MTRRQLLVVPLLLAAPALARGQGTLTLREALARAEGASFQNRIAEGSADAQRAQETAALRGILPSVRVEGGFARTDDPIGAFGTALRQRVITQADFDPRRLNRPAAITNYAGGLVIEQPLFNADAWTGRRAATRMAQAGDAGVEWTRRGTRVDVVRAYYGVTLAHEKVATLSAASRAAGAHLRQAEAMVRQGLATKSDALLASVKAGEIDAQLAEAEADARTSLRQLALVLGQPSGWSATVPARLPDAASIRALLAADTAALPVARRADVEQARLGLAAARADAQRARSLYLPRVNAVGRWDWNSASRLYGGDRSWTVGIMASWSPFAGASEIAELQATDGRADAARAMADAARERAALDVEQTANTLRAALVRLDIAERSVQQSTEAHRIVGRKYEGGLATVTELLDAAATETQSALSLSAARYAAIVAGAERRRALGQDPATLAALDDSSSAVATISR